MVSYVKIEYVAAQKAHEEHFDLVIADDEPAIRNGISANVPWNELGFRVRAVCSNGEEVLNVMRRTPADAVLADIRMKGCSGIELAKTIRRESPHTYVLFLSAYSEFGYAQSAIQYGVWRYLVKPVQFRKLLQTFRELYQTLKNERARTACQTDEPAVTDPLVQFVHEYVRCHCSDVSLTAVAEELDLTPQYLSRLYRQRTGVRFSDYVHRVRMDEAARLLRCTSYRIYEISDIVGYSNPKNFARRFQSYFGSTPSGYRNQR